jgi:HAD superfamily hydrolase (TIGR01484 family)
MRTLDPPTTVSAVLSFDFDGTLHDPAGEPPVPLEFFETIRQLRTDHGAVWGINTGRSMAQVVEGLIESRFPFSPDWVVGREREIYFPNAFGRWLPHEKWNKTCDKEIHRLFKNSRKLLKSIRSEIEQHTGARWLEMEGEPAGVIAQSDEEMAWIAERVAALTQAEPNLGWQRNSIYLRFGHRNYQKGSSLSEVARHYKIGADRCFAIGDSHNDFEMLDAAHAKMSACPANAVDDIKAAVLSHGGYIAKASHGSGAVEALKYYFG